MNFNHSKVSSYLLVINVISVSTIISIAQVRNDQYFCADFKTTDIVLVYSNLNEEDRIEIFQAVESYVEKKANLNIDNICK